MPLHDGMAADEQLQALIAELGSRRNIDPYLISELTKLKTELSMHRNDRDELMAQDQKIIAELKEIRSEFNRMKGFIGGVAFVFSGIGVAAGLVISYFSNFGH